MFGKLNFFRRIGDIVTGDGEERTRFAIGNILYVALAIACAFGLFALYNGRFGGSPGEEGVAIWLGSWLGIAACFLGMLEFALLGVLSQLVLLLCSFFGLLDSEERGGNAAAFFISLLSIGAAVFGVWAIITYVL